MGKGKRSVLACNAAGGLPMEAVVVRPPRQWYYQVGRVQPRNDDDDNYYSRYGYGDRDIGKKATEFIERVHRGMPANDQDG